ncbi:MAG: hypothetical protein EA376_07655 [Phycisphaeraceae bacterium]|nr:MAG: hypothetical protein EA376_07655 [Phycisphaeraceae bacterium]
MGSTIEKKPTGADLDIGDDVFLSPRVVDEGVFTQYAGALRELINRASAAAEQAKQASEAGKPLPALVSALRKDLDAASALLSAAEEKASEARALCEKASDHSLLIQRFEEDAARLIGEEEDRLRAMLAATAELAEQQAAQVKSRLDQWLRSRRDQADALRTLADTIITEAQSRLEGMRGAVDTTVAQADERLAALDETLGSLSLAVQGKLDELEDRSREALDEAVASWEQRAEVARRRLNEEIGPDVQTIERVCEQAGAAAEKAERAGAEAEVARERFDAIHRQADEARRLLSQELLDGAEAIDSLADRKTEIEKQSREAMKLVKAAEKTLTQRVEEARSCFEAPAAELRALAESIAGDANVHIERLRREREASEAAAVRQEETARRLEAALEQLEPWRSVLLTDQAEDELPPKLAEILNRAQRELSRPLRELGAMIQTFALPEQQDAPKPDRAVDGGTAKKSVKRTTTAKPTRTAKKTSSKRSGGR